MTEDDVVDPVVVDDTPPTPVVDPNPPKTRKRTKNGQFEPSMAIDDYEDAIRELRDENAKLRKKQEAKSTARAEKMAEERIKQAKEDAVTAAKAKLDQFKSEMQEQTKQRVLKSELKAAAVKAGVIDFDDLFVVMRNLNEVKYNDDGDVINANELIQEMKEKKPHFFASVNNTSTFTVPRTTRTPALDEKPALKMSKEDYDRGKRMLDQL